MTGFHRQIETRSRDRNTLLCVGIDPPKDLSSTESALLLFGEGIVSATAEYACAFKMNAAFFEQHGLAGMVAFEKLAGMVKAAGIPLICDIKRCDVGHSSWAYSRSPFAQGGAVTLVPYMGRAAFAPYRETGRFTFGMCVSSGDAADSQTRAVDIADGSGRKSMYLHTAYEMTSWPCGGPEHLGLVVGAADKPFSNRSSRVREMLPHHWFLTPGLGAQGGNLRSALAGLRVDNSGVLISSSRSIADARNRAKAAKDLRDRINIHRDWHPVLALRKAGCLLTGDFKLKSGEHTDIYLNMRQLVSDPRTLGLTARILGYIAASLGYDNQSRKAHFAPVPMGALPIGTLMLSYMGEGDRPSMLYPRPVKDHGTRASVEGVYKAGDRVLLVDDVLTSGGSLVEAARTLRREGLEVTEALVFLDRQAGGRQALQDEGVKVHSVLTMDRLRATLEAQGDLPVTRYYDG